MEEKAIVLTDESVREGHVVGVYNKARKDGEPSYHFCIYVQQDKKEFPIMLTPDQLTAAIALAEANKEDIPKKSLLNDLTD